MPGETPQYDVRIHTSLVSGFHSQDAPRECPEVFRGKGQVWIACNHASHRVDANGREMDDQARRVHLIRDVIPAVEATMQQEQQQAEQDIRARQAVRASRPAPAGRSGQQCLCGCGGMTKGGRFIPGHDAKLRGRLIATVKEITQRPEVRRGALEQLRELGWERFVGADVVRSITDSA